MPLRMSAYRVDSEVWLDAGVNRDKQRQMDLKIRLRKALSVSGEPIYKPETLCYTSGEISGGYFRRRVLLWLAGRKNWPSYSVG